MAEQLLTMREARQRAAMGASRWREVCAVDALPILRLNRRFYRVREADLDAWIQAGCPVPEAAEITSRARTQREQRATASGNGHATATRTRKRRDC